MRKTNAQWDAGVRLVFSGPPDPTPSALEVPDSIDESGSCFEVSRILYGVPFTFRYELQVQLEHTAKTVAREHPFGERAWLREYTGSITHDELMSSEAAGAEIGIATPSYTITGVNGVYDIWADDGVTRLATILTGLVPLRVAPTQSSNQFTSSMTVTFTNGEVWLVPGPHSGATWTAPP
jgi:hypothetical protein